MIYNKRTLNSNFLQLEDLFDGKHRSLSERGAARFWIYQVAGSIMLGKLAEITYK